MDGVDLRRFDPAELQDQFTVMFQQPVEYQDTAANNIAFGNLAVAADRRPTSSRRP